MFEYKRLIDKSIKSHTLATDIFGYGLIKTRFADKYLAGQVTMYKAYRWIEKRFRRELEDAKSVQDIGCRQLEMKEDYVWICWLQGIENAPKVVQDCYESVRYWLNNKKIIVITEENLGQYTHFPEFIVEKWKSGIISNTHFSDILRLELLVRYGGLWLDATTFFTGSLPEYITRKDFFVYRNGWMDMEMINMASWLIYSKYTNNILLLKTQKLLYEYWKKYDFLKNYFLLHMLFRIVTNKYQEEWKKVPYFNQVDNHLLMEELSVTYNPTRIKEIKALTEVHKLTYKFDEVQHDCTANFLSEISGRKNVKEDIYYDKNCSKK